MFTNEEVETYMAQVKAQIPYNAHFESIDSLGGAVDFIKEAIFSPDYQDINRVMYEAVRIALAHIETLKCDQGFAAKGRGNRTVMITDLDMASLVNYMPLRLSRFLEGLQAERVVREYLEGLSGVKVLTDRNLDLKIKTKFRIEGDFSADVNHHIDIAVEVKKKLYLLHVFKETSKDRVKKKIQNYMSKKKITHILDYRHGITYPSLTGLTQELLDKQFKAILEGDRVIKIKLDGTVQFNDFE